MKVQCNTYKLSEICQNVQRIVSSKTTIPALEGILFEARDGKILLTGYDLETGMTTDIDATVEEEGKIIINARLLCEILKKIPNETVSIESDERLRCVIKSGSIEYKIIGLDPSDYPELPSVSGGTLIKIKSEILSDLIRKTIFSVAVSESKLVHTGLKFEIENNEITVIGVDGFRIAIKKSEIDYDGEKLEFVVPAKTLHEIMKLSQEAEETEFNIAKRHIIFEVGNYTVISRLLEGEFLNYKAAVPKEYSTVAKINVQNLIGSIERTALVIIDRLKTSIKCIFNDDSIRISSTTQIGTANDIVNADIQGERIVIGFNNRLILDALKACETEDVKISLSGPSRPIVIENVEDSDFMYLVMPVRLKN
ncbi:MAG: DNA polymerase III subunit beta [Clostridia bacterium]|nr:DNA polymerase III subunit beta [Clostridia bacterium]